MDQHVRETFEGFEVRYNAKADIFCVRLGHHITKPVTLKSMEDIPVRDIFSALTDLAVEVQLEPMNTNNIFYEMYLSDNEQAVTMTLADFYYEKLLLGSDI